MGLTWDDTEDYCPVLDGSAPGGEPLGRAFTDLHRWVTEIDAFADDPKASNEAKLEAIQMAWLEEYEEKPVAAATMVREEVAPCH